MTGIFYASAVVLTLVAAVLVLILILVVVLILLLVLVAAVLILVLVIHSVNPPFFFAAVLPLPWEISDSAVSG